MSPERTVASMEAAFYHSRLSLVAEGIRRLADEVEREGKPNAVGVMGTPPFSQAAHRVIHTLLWGVANLNSDQLVDAAGRADVAAQAEAGQT